ncbi:hypothetical protein GCM10010116_02900 [Microbispora rosea subsp. aerata]|nr:DUF4429 domain-containing protein [Microbispora rosea]GGO01562.1 hypothetical protein GCM10010116_02900 [Microbispora rosea subsp. aerata]GIH58338.1 hypothetical protein Mro02_52520 [Microbispora rosea subsp. aerata]GLJ87150.1 hypothetical protein GCM10017588_58940 [Microbispora rosea subsp. aerata]
MTEIVVEDGSWTVDVDGVRIVPGSGRDVHEVRKALGDLVVPLHALVGAVFEPSRKGGHLRLRLRPGADPLTEVAAGLLSAPADPYRLAVPKERRASAEYMAGEIRDLVQLAQVPEERCPEFLLPGPPVPISATAGDGTVSFDGTRVRLEWTAFAKAVKKAAGAQEFLLSDLAGVEWKPQSGLGYGSLRFHLRSEGPLGRPEDDPRCLSWGVQRFGGTSVLVGAAVLARLAQLARQAPQPSAALPSPSSDGRDLLIRRLADLGELHRSGVLTDEEFSAAKKALLDRITEL